MKKRLLSLTLVLSMLLGLTPAWAAAADPAGTQIPHTDITVLGKSGENGDAEKAEYAFDGDFETKWCDNSQTPADTGWVAFQTKAPTVLTHMRVEHAEGHGQDSQSNNTIAFSLQYLKPGLDPDSPDLDLGSDANWLDLVAVDNSQQLQSTDTPIPVGAAHQYFRLNVTEGDGANNSWEAVRIYEVELWQDANAVPTLFLDYNAGGDALSQNTPLSVEGVRGSGSVTYTIPHVDPIRGESGNYAFLGWSADPDAVTPDPGLANPASGESVSHVVTPISSATLYGVWERTGYTLTLDPSGGELTADTISIPAVPGAETVTFPFTEENTPTLAGHTFLGWAKTPGASLPELTPEQLAEGWTTAPGDDTLYAVWEKTDFILTLDPSGGAVTPETAVGNRAHGEKSVTYRVPADVVPLYEGRAFLGWAKTSGAAVPDFPAGQPVEWTLPLAMDKTLYAVWQENSYTLTYHTRFEPTPEPAIASKAQLTDDFVTFPIDHETVPFNPGCTFLGWAKTPGAAVPDFPAGQPDQTWKVSPARDMDLYAVFEKSAFTLIYDSNDGSGQRVDGQSAEKDPDGSVTFSLFDAPGFIPSTSRHTFLGWDREPDAVTPELPAGTLQLKLEAPADVTLYAVWSADTYHMTYQGMPGEPVVAPRNEDGSVTFPVNTDQEVACEYPNETFLGWDPDPYAAVPLFPRGQGVKQWHLDKGSDRTLYLIFSYSLDFDPNLPAEAPPDAQVSGLPAKLEGVTRSSGDSLYFPLPLEENALTLTDHWKFLGWAKAPQAVTPDFPAAPGKGTVRTDLSGVTEGRLYAVWAGCLVYDGSAGGAPVDGLPAPSPEVSRDAGSVSYRHSDLIPRRDGFTFLGWAYTPDAAAPEALSGTVSVPLAQARPTLYALWSPNHVRPGQQLYWEEDFEAAGAAASLPRGWFVPERPGEAPHWTVQNNSAHHGTWSAASVLPADDSGLIMEPLTHRLYTAPFAIPREGGRLTVSFRFSDELGAEQQKLQVYVLADNAETPLPQPLGQELTAGPSWQEAELDLTPWAGHTVRLLFAHHWDGTGGIDQRYSHTLYMDCITVMIPRDARIPEPVKPAAHRLTPDPCGGVLTGGAVTSDGEGRFRNLPVPLRDGLVFEGWYTQPQGGQKLEPWDVVLMNDQTLYAHWADRPQVTLKDGDQTVEVLTPDANGDLERLPCLRDNARGDFVCWLDEAGQIFTGTHFDADTTLTAKRVLPVLHFRDVDPVTGQALEGELLPPITGRVSVDGDTASLQFILNRAVFPSRSGCTFQGWAAEAGGDSVKDVWSSPDLAVTDTDPYYTVSGLPLDQVDSAQLFARWAVVEPASPSPALTLRLDPSGGILPEGVTSVTTDRNGYAVGLPVPTHSDPALRFNGWILPHTTQRLTADVPISGSGVLTASWVPAGLLNFDSQTGPHPIQKAFLLNNVDGLPIVDSSLSTSLYADFHNFGEEPGAASPTFLGWFDRPAGGRRVSSDLFTGTDYRPMLADGQVTLYAQWSAHSLPGFHTVYREDADEPVSTPNEEGHFLPDGWHTDDTVNRGNLWTVTETSSHHGGNSFSADASLFSEARLFSPWLHIPQGGRLTFHYLISGPIQSGAVLQVFLADGSSAPPLLKELRKTDQVSLMSEFSVGYREAQLDLSRYGGRDVRLIFSLSAEQEDITYSTASVYLDCVRLWAPDGAADSGAGRIPDRDNTHTVTLDPGAGSLLPGVPAQLSTDAAGHLREKDLLSLADSILPPAGTDSYSLVGWATDPLGQTCIWDPSDIELLGQLFFHRDATLYAVWDLHDKPGFTQVYRQDFESTADVDRDWQLENMVQSIGSHHGSYCYKTETNSAASSAVSPPLAIQAGDRMTAAVKPDVTSIRLTVRVTADETGPIPPAQRTQVPLAATSYADNGWSILQADLSAYAGKTVELIFSTEGGGDHFYLDCFRLLRRTEPGTVACTWAPDGSACTAVRTLDGRQETAQARITSHISLLPGVNTEGQTTYTAAFDVPWAEVQSMTLTDLPMCGDLDAEPDLDFVDTILPTMPAVWTVDSYGSVSFFPATETSPVRIVLDHAHLSRLYLYDYSYDRGIRDAEIHLIGENSISGSGLCVDRASFTGSGHLTIDDMDYNYVHGGLTGAEEHLNGIVNNYAPDVGGYDVAYTAYGQSYWTSGYDLSAELGSVCTLTLARGSVCDLTCVSYVSIDDPSALIDQGGVIVSNDSYVLLPMTFTARVPDVSRWIRQHRFTGSSYINTSAADDGYTERYDHSGVRIGFDHGSGNMPFLLQNNLVGDALLLSGVSGENHLYPGVPVTFTYAAPENTVVGYTVVEGDRYESEFRPLTPVDGVYTVPGEAITADIVLSSVLQPAEGAPAAPAPGEGYTINFPREQITVKTGFEVNTSPAFDGTALTSGASLTDYIGRTLYIRKTAVGETPAGAAALLPIPGRPAAPDFPLEFLPGQGPVIPSGYFYTTDLYIDQDIYPGIAWYPGTDSPCYLMNGDVVHICTPPTRDRFLSEPLAISCNGTVSDIAGDLTDHDPDALYYVQYYETPNRDQGVIWAVPATPAAPARLVLQDVKAETLNLALTESAAPIVLECRGVSTIRSFTSTGPIQVTAAPDSGKLNGLVIQTSGALLGFASPVTVYGHAVLQDSLDLVPMDADVPPLLIPQGTQLTLGSRKNDKSSALTLKSLDQLQIRGSLVNEYGVIEFQDAPGDTPDAVSAAIRALGMADSPDGYVYSGALFGGEAYFSNSGHRLHLLNTRGNADFTVTSRYQIIDTKMYVPRNEAVTFTAEKNTTIPGGQRLQFTAAVENTFASVLIPDEAGLFTLPAEAVTGTADIVASIVDESTPDAPREPGSCFTPDFTNETVTVTDGCQVWADSNQNQELLTGADISTYIGGNLYVSLTGGPAVSVPLPGRPAAPQLINGFYSTAADRFTVTAPLGEQYQYRMDDGLWQAQPDFSFTPDYQPHRFAVRLAPTDTGFAGEAMESSFRFAPAAASLSVTLADWTYGEAAPAPQVTTDSDGKVTFRYKLTTQDDSCYQDYPPAMLPDAGSYVLEAAAAATATHNAVRATAVFTVRERPLGDMSFTLDAPVAGQTPDNDVGALPAHVAGVSVSWTTDEISPSPADVFRSRTGYLVTLTVTPGANYCLPAEVLVVLNDMAPVETALLDSGARSYVFRFPALLSAGTVGTLTGFSDRGVASVHLEESPRDLHMFTAAYDESGRILSFRSTEIVGRSGARDVTVDLGSEAAKAALVKVFFLNTSYVPTDAGDELVLTRA